MHISCPVCASDADRRYRWQAPFYLCFCQKCGTIFADPMPSDEALANYYQGFLYRRPAAEAIEPLVRSRMRELRELFGENLKAGAKFLDFGGGTGMATLAAARLGLDVTFQEVDLRAHAFVSKIAPASPIRFCRDLKSIETGFFDLIFADNVIEHVKDPQALLRQLYRHLAPGGQLVLKTPHARNTELLFHPAVAFRGYLRRVYRFGGLRAAVSAAFFRPWACDPPRHLYAFSATSLALLAKQAEVDASTIGSHRAPLWEYSSTQKLAVLPHTPMTAVKWGIRAGIAPFEALSKIVETTLHASRLITPGGLILHIDKKPAASFVGAKATSAVDRLRFVSHRTSRQSPCYSRR